MSKKELSSARREGVTKPSRVIKRAGGVLRRGLLACLLLLLQVDR